MKQGTWSERGSCGGGPWRRGTGKNSDSEEGRESQVWGGGGGGAGEALQGLGEGVGSGVGQLDLPAKND